MSSPAVGNEASKKARERTSTDEIQAQMQLMIDLQYEQQNSFQQHQDEQQVRRQQSGGTRSTEETSDLDQEPPKQHHPPPPPLPPAPPLQPLASTSYANLYGDYNEVGQGTLHFYHSLDQPSSAEPIPPPPPAASLAPSEHQQQHNYGTWNDDSQRLLLLQEDHQFHYGNPDYHDPFASENHRHHTRKSKAAECCCCFVSLWNCIQSLLEAESLHRSFCYGAIDGMLTGSGIVSTFCGMQLLSSESTMQIRALVVVFSAAACFADSLCMALGHVWTSYVLVTGQSNERGLARLQLTQNRADSKGQLVDMLLARGMLKIDAMSLVDTLEGYPDLFVSVMTGDSLTNDAVISAHQQQPPFGASDDETVGRTFGNAPVRGFRRPFTRHDEMDPEAQVIRSAMNESRNESFFMMLGFSLFAVVPSLIFWIMPAHHKHNNIVHSSTLSVLVTACVMWCLGVWKSRFVDSNWMLFGIETVVVLLICILSAYSLGNLLGRFFLPTYLLKVATAVTKVTAITDDL